MKLFTKFIFLSLVLLLPCSQVYAESFCTKTKDYQFVIYSTDEKKAVSVKKIAEKYPLLLQNTLSFFYHNDTPTIIYIESPLDWESEDLYTIVKNKKEKTFNICNIKDIETNAIFPGLTLLTICEVLKDEKDIHNFKNPKKHIPVWLREGLWRHLVGFNSKENLNKIKTLDMEKLLKADYEKMTEDEKEIYHIKSAFFINYLLYLPYGNINLRNLSAAVYKKSARSQRKRILKTYGIKKVKDFNRKWNNYLQATLLSGEIN